MLRLPPAGIFHMGQIRQKERGKTFQGKIKQDDGRKHQQRREEGEQAGFHGGRQETVNGPVQHERQKAGGSQQSYFRRQAGPAYMIIMTPRSMPMAVSFHRGITPAEYSAISTTGIKMLTQKKMPNFLFINR